MLEHQLSLPDMPAPAEEKRSRLVGNSRVVAAALQCSVSEARKYIRGEKLVDGRRIPVNQVGRRLKVNIQALDEMLLEGARARTTDGENDARTARERQHISGPSKRPDNRVAGKVGARGAPRRRPSQSAVGASENKAAGSGQTPRLTIVEGGPEE